MHDVLTLQSRFALPGHLDFLTGPNNLPVAEIHNAHASARISLYGAQVLHWQPHGQAPVIWLSARSSWEAGKPIRGGIPLCFPWFGPHPSRSDLPLHGFARLMTWEVLGATVADGGATRLRLGLRAGECTRPALAADFALELVVTVGRELEVELIMRNPGAEAFTVTSALHSYFSVGDSRQITLTGLEGKRFLTKVGTASEGTQEGPLRIAAELDRVYLETAGEVTIHDPVLRRRLVVAKTGSRSTVVWNPWVDKSAKMPDFGDQEYLGMVCVEACNALADAATVPAGGVHRLRTVIRVAPL